MMKDLAGVNAMPRVTAAGATLRARQDGHATSSIEGTQSHARWRDQTADPPSSVPPDAFTLLCQCQYESTTLREGRFLPVSPLAG
jgi:hypothetical protein